MRLMALKRANYVSRFLRYWTDSVTLQIGAGISATISLFGAAIRYARATMTRAQIGWAVVGSGSGNDQRNMAWIVEKV
jgi:hypothetical protein